MCHYGTIDFYLQKYIYLVYIAINAKKIISFAIVGYSVKLEKKCVNNNLVTSSTVHAGPRLALVDVHLAVLAREPARAHAVVVADAVQARRAVLTWDWNEKIN